MEALTHKQEYLLEKLKNTFGRPEVNDRRDTNAIEALENLKGFANTLMKMKMEEVHARG